MSTNEPAWFKSSYSGDSSGDCVEVGLDWRKSSYSSGSEGDCVEVAPCPSTIHVRDSKNPQGPQMNVTPQAWEAFLTHTSKR
ncbi:DUF397 domain-containing protein [Streptomyces flavofungini]|uniref:DUF397 domain-containing protein n=1 Tax=Streptomyces flavofungini TaxID=68200 RepID=UPI0034DF69BE